MNTPEQPYRTTIDDVPYVCFVQPALQANASLLTLTSLLSPTTVSLLSGAVKGFDKNTLSIESIGRMDFVTGLVMLFQELTPDQGNKVLSAGLVGISTPGHEDLSAKTSIDSHFRGRLLHMYKVFGWALSCNYKDFLDVARSVASMEKLTALMGLMRSATQSMPDSQSDTSPTATPPSTDSSSSVIQ